MTTNGAGGTGRNVPTSPAVCNYVAAYTLELTDDQAARLVALLYGTAYEAGQADLREIARALEAQAPALD